MVWRKSLGKYKLKIGELSALAGVTNRTIDYYTTLGLLDFKRSDNNYRFYSIDMVERIHEIEHLKDEGMHLNDIKKKYAPTEAIDIQDIRLKISELEADIRNISQTDNLNEAKALAVKDLALIKTLLLFIQH